ncbi:hypothetical protein AAHA92_06520 [Salvia divinorum]|uniref:Uncharacterized protein n=1 Tax=Salvia divinorum TaxID=28513 RepID=A0ABD1I5X6_SALDI
MIRFRGMYNTNKKKKQEHNKAPPMSVSSRISFSNDLVESSRSHSHYHDAPVSSDFEFSVSNYSMMSADELFFKGRLLPFPLKEEEEEENNINSSTTLKNDVSLRPPKNPTRWRAFLGLTKSHIGSKKQLP